MKIDWKIIRNWALGEASEKEKQEVERWGEMGEENRNFLEDTYNYYCEESMVENPSPENMKRVWRKLDPYRQMRRRRMRQMSLVAASVILGIGIFWGDHFFSGVKMEKTFSRTIPVRLITSDGIQHDLNKGTLKDSLKVGFKNEISEGLQLGTVIQKKEMTERFHEIIVPRCGEYRLVLSDGTRIYLNAESSLRFPDVFGDERKVYLTGEAYFEVSKDPKHPFIVQTETIDVQVLGTHFNVDAYRNNPEVKTTLLTGSVAVSNKSNSVRMILKPNEIAIYNKVGNKLTRQVTKNAKDEISWRDGEFIFDNLPLGEIARELSNSFDTPIHIADTSLQSYRISARFRNGEDLETILSVLHHAGYFNYSQNNKQIVITTKPDLK